MDGFRLRFHRVEVSDCADVVPRIAVDDGSPGKGMPIAKCRVTAGTQLILRQLLVNHETIPRPGLYGNLLRNSVAAAA